MSPKLIIFAPIILFFGFFFMLVIGFFALVFWLIKKQKDSSWFGTVIDKKYVQKRDFDTDRIERYYSLVFQTTTGQKRTLGISREMYDQYEIGDQAEKRPGALFPTKVS